MPQIIVEQTVTHAGNDRQQLTPTVQQVEPVFGSINEILGYRRFLRRGRKKAQGECRLIYASFNLRLYGSQAASRKRTWKRISRRIE